MSSGISRDTRDSIAANARTTYCTVAALIDEISLSALPRKNEHPAQTKEHRDATNIRVYAEQMDELRSWNVNTVNTFK